MANLGLPFEYQISPEYFDAYNLSADTNEKNAIIESILKKYQVKTVLDITCGTGSQVFFLAQQNYDVIGADFSPALIEIARRKAVQQNINVQFIDGDMRTLHVGQFDAVISIFNAIGHLSKADFEKALGNINGNLRPGGIYVFDIMNLEALSDEAVANLAWHIQKKVGDMHIHGIQCSILDRKEGILTAFDHVVLQKNAEKPEFHQHTFSLKIYTANELREILNRHGFEVLDQCGLDGASFIKEKTPNIVTVARKNAG